MNYITFLKKDIRRYIGRFSALALSVMVAVGCFAGILSFSPDMRATADEYYDAKNFWDIRIKSTQGFTDDDIIALKAEEYVLDAQGTVSFDLTASVNGKQETAVRLYGVDFDSLAADESKYISAPVLTDGTYPINEKSCIAVVGEGFSEDIKIGDRVFLTSGGDKFSEIAYTVTGLAECPEFVSGDKNTGDAGEIGLSVYVWESVYVSPDVYTDIFVTLNTAKDINAFGGEYEKAVSAAKEKIEELADHREADRQENLSGEYESAKEKAEKEYEYLQQETAQQIQNQKDFLDALQKDIEKAEEANAEQEKALAAEKARLDALSPRIDALRFKDAAATPSEKAQIEKFDADMEKYQSDFIDLEAAKRAVTANKTVYEDTKKRYADNEKQLELELQNAQQQFGSWQEGDTPNYTQRWMVYTRGNNAGFAMLKSNINRGTALTVVSAILCCFAAAVVSIGVALSFMDDKTELTAYENLGYSKKQMTVRFALLSAAAAVAGGVIGIVIGTAVLPQILYRAYGVLYNFAEVTIHLYPLIILFSIVLAAVIGAVPTYYICKHKFNSHPRKSNRFIEEKLLEVSERFGVQITASVRYILNNKIRILLLLAGTVLSAAMLAHAFGLNFSVSKAAEKQYTDIIKYDALITLKDGADYSDNDALKEALAGNEALPIYSEQLSLKTDGVNVSLTLMVPTDNENFGEFVSLRTPSIKKDITLTKSSVVLPDNFAENNNISKGDKITVNTLSGGTAELTVTDIAENYKGDYLYMSADGYKAAFGGDATENTLLIKHPAYKTSGKIDALLYNTGAVSSVTYLDREAAVFDEIAESLGGIRNLLLCISLSLLFLTVYGLTSLDKARRKNEIKTLRTMGYTALHSAVYLFRETAVISGVGVIIGGGIGALIYPLFIGGMGISDIAFTHSAGFLAVLFAVLLSLAVLLVSLLVSATGIILKRK